MNNLFKKNPCIIGVAQHTYRDNSRDAPHPLLQAVEISKEAAKDCGNEKILQYIDELDAVLSISWGYDNLPQQIAQELHLKEGDRKLSGLSGTGPQRFINEAAENILSGNRSAVLICGAEAFATKKRAKKAGRLLDWPKATRKAPPPFEDPFHPTEISHQLFQAYTTFALLDSARRAHHRLSLEQNRKQQAEMMARLSSIAANNPAAWFPKQHSAASLFNLENNDRMVAYPFTKNTMAFMDVDMAAGLIITSNELADELNIAQEKRIYLNGWGYAKEPPYLAQREHLWRCPSMEFASQTALRMAGLGIDDINHMDLYSCFSGNLNFTKEVLGIEDNDPRSLTVTGGLPYFGGPGNNYTTHSIATMVKKLREHPTDSGLISGVGMHMTHHVFAVYSSLCKPIHLNHQCNASEPHKIPITDTANGIATIAAYTVEHNKHGNSAIAICDLMDGSRCYARCDDPVLISNMEQEEWVGKKVALHSDNNINLFELE